MPVQPFDFDEVIERRGTHARKWDAMEELFGVSPETGIPLWVADMEFRPPPEVVEALRATLDNGVFGYFGDRSDYDNAVIGWMQRHHEWHVEPDWLATTHGLVSGLHLAVQAFCEPGDGVILQTPIYYPFSWAVKHNGARIIENPLQIGADGRAMMNIVQLAEAIDDRTRMIMVCSPHNPGGRVWTRDELVALTDLCVERDLIIVTDEVHQDLVYSGHRHTPIATLGDAVAERCVILNSASKTFNIAGLATGSVIIPNEELRHRFVRTKEAAGIFGPNLMGAVGSAAAYEHGDRWLAALLVYLEANRDLVATTLSEQLPGIRSVPLEGTYLAWLDCAGFELPMPEVIRRVERDARLAFNYGETFGEAGTNHLRMNFALSRSVLSEALERMISALGV